MNLQNFRKELILLGQSDKERAEKLGVVPKTIERYRKGILPKAILGFYSCPDLLRALADDAEQAEKEPGGTPGGDKLVMTDEMELSSL
jgi:hypothetical protein